MDVFDQYLEKVVYKKFIPNIKINNRSNLLKLFIGVDFKISTQDIIQGINSNTDEILDKIMGGFVSLLIGSSSALPYKYNKIQNVNEKKLEKNSNFKKPIGMYADEIGITKCISESLLIQNTYNELDIKLRYYNWINNGYCHINMDDINITDLSNNFLSNINDLDINDTKIDHNEELKAESLLNILPIMIFLRNVPEQGIYICQQQSLLLQYHLLNPIYNALFSYILNYIIQNNSQDDKSYDSFKQLLQVSLKEWLNIYKTQIFYIGKTSEDYNIFLEGLLEMEYICKSENLLDIEYFNWKNSNYFSKDSLNNSKFGNNIKEVICGVFHLIYQSESFFDILYKGSILGGYNDIITALASQLVGSYFGMKYILANPQLNTWFKYMNRWDKNRTIKLSILLFSKSK